MSREPSLFSQAELERLAGKDALKQARASLDAEAISHFKFDARGRIEGGVKPAGPDRLPPSYVRITKRGSRSKIECRHCQSNQWCQHALALALHHLGVKPVFHVKAQPSHGPRLGFEICLWVDDHDLHIGLRSQSSGRLLQNPLRFCRENPKTVSLSARALELLSDLGRDQLTSASVVVERADANALLLALSGSDLSDHERQPWSWGALEHPLPKLNARIEGDRIQWWLEEPLALSDKAEVVPGRPGWVIDAGRILRGRDYTPDYQWLLGLNQRGNEPLDLHHLMRFITERHAVRWHGTRPLELQHTPEPLLKLEPTTRGLIGTLGLAVGDAFAQWIQLTSTHGLALDQTGRHLIVRTSPSDSKRIEADKTRTRAAWDGFRFHVARGDAAGFLERTKFPSLWDVQRGAADRWYGLEERTLVTHWDGGQTPTYELDGLTLDHASLVRSIVAPHQVALPDGQIARVDTTPITRNDAILNAAGTLHDDPDLRQSLIRKLRGLQVETNDQWDHPSARLLRPYQRTGVDWLRAAFARSEPALLADDMGLGKTFQALVFLDSAQGDRPQLVVAPRSILGNWKRECQRFTSTRQVHIHHGPKRADTADDLRHKDLLLTSYGTLRQDAELFAKVQFQVVVLDEAQAIKNPDALTTRAVCDLQSQHRLALTGTPIENRLEELWSIFQFLAPGYLGPREAARGIGHTGSARYRLLRDLTQPFMLRRLKREVEPDLPQKQEILVKLPLSTLQQRLYQAVRQDACSQLDAQTESKNTMQVLTKLLRMRQICCHPGLIDDQFLGAPSPKFDFVIDHLQDLVPRGHAALVFSQFTSLLGLLKFELEERAIDHLYLDGSTSNRDQVVDAFQNGNAPVFLISLKAGGVGLNLTRASYVFLLDPWWNPMVEAQATDRAYRIGQTQTVFTYRIATEATVEDRILAMQAQKRALADEIWDDGESLLGSLSDADLRSLFT